MPVWRVLCVCLFSGWLALSWLGAGTARAHAIWIESLASGSKVAIHVGFGEPNQWDQKNVGKIDATAYVVRGVDGKSTPVVLMMHPRAKCYVGMSPVAGDQAIYGEVCYGVSKHGPKPSLVYFTAKHYMGPANQWRLLDGVAKRLELHATLAGAGKWRLMVTMEGKPAANSKITAILPDATELPLVADAEGVVTVESAKPGLYQFLASYRQSVPGTHQGEVYDEVHDVATLSVHHGSESKEAEGEAQPAAATAMMAALKAQSLWDEKFPGFTANVSMVQGDQSASAKLRVGRDGAVELDWVQGPDAWKPLAQEWFDSLVWHRRMVNTGSDQAHGARGELPQVAQRGIGNQGALELTPIGDPYGTRFIVKGNALQTAMRTMGDRRQRIDILETQQSAEGSLIPTLVAVSFWNAAGELTQSETERRDWKEVGGYLLPARIEQVIARQPTFIQPDRSQRWVIELTDQQLQ
jgi:hypothetical protein